TSSCVSCQLPWSPCAVSHLQNISKLKKLLARYTTDGKESLQKSYLFRAFCKKDWSGREDSNLRPLGPKPSALPGCATPRLSCIPIDKTGYSSHHQKPWSRIAKNLRHLSQPVHDDLFGFSVQLTTRQTFGHSRSEQYWII